MNRSNIESLLNSAMSIRAKVILVLDSCNLSEFDAAITLSDSMDGCIKVLQTNCQNPGTARNVGLQICTTRWVTFWDSDDAAYPEELMEMILAAEKESSDVAIGRYTKVAQKDLEKNLRQTANSEKLSDKNWQLEVGLSPGIWRFAFKSEVIKNIVFPELRMGEDQVFIQRTFQKDVSIHLDEKIVYEYRIGNSQQLTTDRSNLNDLTLATDISINEFSSVHKKFRDIAKIMIIKKCLTLLLRHNCTFRQYARYTNQIILMSLSDIPLVSKSFIRILKTIAFGRMPKSA